MVGAGATVGASANASVSVPVIAGVDVSVGTTSVKIAVNASASAGGALTFVWSGAGIVDSVVGTHAIELPVSAILDSATKTVNVLVQSADGVVSQVQITLDTVTGLLGKLNLLGTATTTIHSLTALASSAKACVDSHLSCVTAAAAGSLDTKASALLKCAVDLSGCVLKAVPGLPGLPALPALP
jgi:hypothetical protein